MNAQTHGSSWLPRARCALILLILLQAALPLSPRAEPRREPIRPIPEPPALDPRLTALGARLFQDPRLSADDTISCASCHDLATNGADGRARPIGVGGIIGAIKTPTIYNSMLNFAQCWDGRVPTLEMVVGEALTNPTEMGSSWSQAIGKLSRDRQLVAEFEALFDEGLTANAIATAIAAFQRTLLTPNSRFDRWLRGDDQALSDEELRGYRLFKSYGCVSCHQGANVGGNMYCRMGTLGDYFAERGGEITEADLGRFNLTGLQEDLHLFKVPSLRLAVRNAPYFHDGSAATLTEAIQLMARYQLGRSIPDPHVEAIIAFLHTLVGEHPRLEQ